MYAPINYMKILRILLLLLLNLWITSGCGKKTKPRTISVPEQIAARAMTYRSLIGSTEGVQDNHGFIDYKHCDSLLFSSLISVAGISVDLRAAEKDPGEWYRRPLAYSDCYETGESKSRISRDMILGVMFAAYYNKDIQMLQDLWNYGSKNSWIMGKVKEADNSLASLMSSNYISLLARMLHKLSSKDYSARFFPIVLEKNPPGGFQNHLLVLYLLLLSEVNDGLTDSQLDLLEKVSTENPENLLYVAAARKFGIDRPWPKIDDRIYPAHRLPNTTDRCEGWATQRDDSDKGLQPGCFDNRPFQVHSGGDLIFVDWLLREYGRE